MEERSPGSPESERTATSWVDGSSLYRELVDEGECGALAGIAGHVA
jgi:hypothetical protein